MSILFPEELILKYQQHSMSLTVHCCPNFQAPIICFNESLSFSPPAFLSLCRTHIYFFLTFCFTCPTLWLALWQVIISYPIFRGKTVIHCRRLVAALWTSTLSPVESCDLPLASCSEKLKEKHAPDSYHSISKLMILSLFLSLSLWLKNDGSTERNSSGVYQSVERLKTCYCWLCLEVLSIDSLECYRADNTGI